MQVCVDIQSAVAQRAGVGRYTKQLVEHLALARGRDTLSLFYFDFQRKGTPFPVPEAAQAACRWLPGRIAQKAWKTVGWPPFDWFAGAADVYHFPNFIRPPLSRGRSVVTVHDLSFVRFPETLEERNLQYLTRCMRDTVQRSDAIITDSVAIADELIGHFQVDPRRVHPIHLGLNEHVARPAAARIQEARQRLGLQRPYLLSVGTLEPRKNFTFLVEAFERLRGFDGELVIAGMRGWKYEGVLEHMRTSSRVKDIRYLEYVPDADLCALYAGAELFVFPSLYEGFGFTPLEAMACGTPVISSAEGSLPEVLGDAAVILRRADADIWAREIERLLGDATELNALRIRGRQKAESYTWQETARKTWDVYRGLGA